MKYNTIAIEGNIGSGKTTLAALLAERLGIELVLETFENNPFLTKFYAHPKEYALPVELFFLTERFAHLQKGGGKHSVADYTLIKSLLFAQVTLSDDELMLFERLFNMAYHQIKEPDLTIYLHCPIELLLKQIKERGRPYEQNIQPAYLERLEQSYLNYYHAKQAENLLILDAAELNFVNDEDDLQMVIDLLT